MSKKFHLTIKMQILKFFSRNLSQHQAHLDKKLQAPYLGFQPRYLDKTFYHCY